MPYNANIPQATDAISDSQNDILDNFQSINTWAQVNHVGFDSPPNTGKHFFVEMPQQGAASVTAIGEVGLQCLASAFGAGSPTLVFLPENAGTPVEMTSAQKAASGWTILPSGILLKWGSITVNAYGTTNFVYPVGAIPPFSAVYLVQLQSASNNLNSDYNITANYNTQASTNLVLTITTLRRDVVSPGILPATVLYFALGSV
jgi:hypothetical protein